MATFTRAIATDFNPNKLMACRLISRGTDPEDEPANASKEQIGQIICKGRS